MSLTYLMKSMQEANPDLRRFYECAGSTFDSFKVFNTVFRVGMEALADHKKMVAEATPGNDRVSQLVRSFNSGLVEFKHIPTLRIAHFLVLYGFCEGTINHICRIFYPHIHSEIKLCDLRGWGMDRVSIYLKKVVGVELPDYFVLEGKLLTEVRNALIHMNGIVTDDNATKIKKCQDHILNNSPKNQTKDIRHNLAKSCFVSEGENGEKKLLLGEGFTESMLVLIQIMFSKLLGSCELKLRTILSADDSTGEK